jgi:hypothetical protein
VEALYRPGERELAVELALALGCTFSDTGFLSDAGTTFLAIHANPDDPDPQNNVFYISEITPEHAALEEQLHRLCRDDAGLKGALADYRRKAQTRPFGVPHFALHYPSADALDEAVQRVEATLGPRLGERIHFQIFRHPVPGETGREIVQAFLYQDVIISGSFLMGQLIELQA